MSDTMPARSVLRAVRAATFAVVCVLLALLGHTLMSDASVPWAATGSAGVAIALLVWVVADRERGFPAITGAMFAAQAALHALFTLAQRPPPPIEPPSAALETRWLHVLLCNDDTPGTGPTRSVAEILIRMRLDPNLARQTPESAGFGGGSSGFVSGSPFGDTSSSAHHAAAGAGAGMRHGGAMMSILGDGGRGMFAAHVLAALACAVWLRHGEKAVFRLLRLLAVLTVTVVVALVAAWSPVPATR
ncbi:hypothetical protein, partial [Streptomyces sp. SID3343]|uniref:hypothetical protein n=1 Tax=Streptomyces sp. SID3343 TaxID=2690260 RepID=UPI0013BFFB56